MNKQDFMKLQTCVLKVDIQCACDGCNQKIKKLLNKIDGVYKTSIDLEQGKVTVYGNADPGTLIKKLNKSGKHAEIWGPQKGVNFMNNQFKNMSFDNKNQKGGGGKGNQQMQAINNKGFKDFKPNNKDQKSVKFNLPVGGGGGFGGGGGGRGGSGFEDEDDFDDDDDDEFDDEFDDDSSDGYDYKRPNKMMTGPPGVGGYGPNGPMGMMNGKNGPSGGFELPVQMKGKGGYGDSKKGNSGKKGGGGGDKDGGKKKSKGGSSGGGGFGGLFGVFGGGKKKQGVSNPKGGKKGGDGGGWDKKGGGKHHDEGKFSGNKQNEFLDFNKPKKGGGGGNMGHNGGNGGNSGRSISQMGGNPMMAQMRNHPMGQMGGYPMGQMPMAQMAYRGQGMDHGNPYNNQQQYQQQQYMQGMMMMNQQKANMHPQMMYGQAPPFAYGPPMGAHGNDNMTHIFSDENTDSCSIM